MKFTFTVKRNRQSVTQGTATVFLNDIEVITFGDTIELVNKDDQYYGEIIGGWASVIPDKDFVKGLLFHPFDNFYQFSNKVKVVLETMK